MEQIVDGSFGSYCSYIYEDLPEVLKDRYADDIGDTLMRDIQEIVREYLYVEKVAGSSKYGFTEAVSLKEIEKVKKKQRYNGKAVLEAVERDYNLVIGGAPIKNTASPFCDLIVNTLCRTGKKKAEVVDDIYERATEWLDRYLNFKDVAGRNEWLKENVGFCTYPFFYLIEEGDPSKTKRLLNIDLTDNIFRLSSEPRYKSFSIYSPKSILGEGFISESRRKDSKFRASYDKDLLASTNLDVFFSDEARPVEKIDINASRTWDYEDLEILNYLTTKCIRESKDVEGVLSVSGSLTEICAVLYPDVKGRRFNTKHYEAAKERLTNVFTTRLSARVGGKEVTKAIFEYTVIDDPGGGSAEDDARKRKTILFQASFGARIAGDILSNRLEVFIRPQIEGLGDEVSRMLFMSMKADRAQDLILFNSAVRYHSYSHNDLLIIIRLDGHKAKRVERYERALEELKDRGLLVESFERTKTGGFMVKWLPLSGEEKENIRSIPVQDGPSGDGAEG